jgi:hypothetical protein
VAVGWAEGGKVTDDPTVRAVAERIAFAVAERFDYHETERLAARLVAIARRQSRADAGGAREGE